MSLQTFSFKLGSFECTVISDGTFEYHDPTHLFFVNAPKEQLRQALKQHTIDIDQWKQHTTPYLCLYINTGQYRVLVDTGAGSFMPSTGKLIPNLKNEGIRPEDIDTVILTHGHPDHIGGTVDSEDRPAFPNARYVMMKEEWEFWTSEPDLKELGIPDEIKKLIIKFAERNLPPIKNQLDQVEHDDKIVPGIRALATPGHTPGHMTILISSEDSHLLNISDAAIHPLHIEEPGWYSAVDFNQKQTVTTRCQLLEKAYTENTLVLAFHFDFPGLGRIIPKRETWYWQRENEK